MPSTQKENVMRIAALIAGALLLGTRALAEPTETEIPNVSAEVVELRTSGGVTRLGIRYSNTGPETTETKRFEIGKIVLVDVKSKRKHLPIKDANGQFIGGPIGDTIDGGRIRLTLPPGQPGVLWTYFDALPAGTVVSVEVPQMFPFEDVVVSEGTGTLLSATGAKSTPSMAIATLVSAKRADEALKVRLKLAAEPGMTMDMRSPYFMYAWVSLFDPVNKRRYPLLKDSEGIAQATPIGQKMDGGTFIPNWSEPILMSLTFQAPPDDVTSVDLMLPDFLPIEGVAIAGLGGAGAGGIAASGATLGLAGALKELKAQVTPQEIKIDLSADVLFDFDKADLKPSAEAQLNHLLTVVNSKPTAAVAIEGHTDVRGDAAYNQALAQRRAESVRTWLTAHDVAASRLTATGAGESRPVRSGETEADHQANRRVEIRIRN
jgi:outer membrane protein OmpA-like peptidoglycan-associated protein